MTTNGSKSYIGYLKKLVDQYNNTYYHSINKNLLMLIILFWLKKLSRILRLLRLKLMIESNLLSIRTFLAKVPLKNGQEKYFSSILFWKLILILIKLRI